MRVLCVQGPPGLSSGVGQVQEQKEGGFGEENGAVMTRLGRVLAVGPPLPPGPYYWSLFPSHCLALFRGLRGLQASQAQLESLQW